MTELATMHSLRRTSPKGTPFIGTCVLCGEEGLMASDVAKPCANLRRSTLSDALVEAINGNQS